MKTAILKTTIDQLIDDEALLDQQCNRMQRELLRTQRDPDNTFYAYVLREDLVDCFGDNLVLTMRNFDYYETDAVIGLAREMKVWSHNQTPADVRLVVSQAELDGQRRAGGGGSSSSSSNGSGSSNGAASPPRARPTGKHVSPNAMHDNATFLMSPSKERKRFRLDFDGPPADDDGNSSDSR